jgi:carnitine 3-dehydrogenase
LKAAIVGGGVIGGGWAARFALNGWDVSVFDPAPDAQASIDETLTRARASLPALYDNPLPREGIFSFAADIEHAVDGAVWVQESVPETLEVKRSVLTEILAASSDKAVVASSTSGFRPTLLADGLRGAGKFLVCHPFNPVYLLPLVEVVPGDATKGSTRADAVEILEGIGMKPLVVRREIDAHIADRLLEAVWREALWLVKDGVATTGEIDDAIRYGFGLRWAHMGLFETYRLAGGASGMGHFLEQFGPALQWPWSKLTDVPDLDANLVNRIVEQCETAAAGISIEESARQRDVNLVAVMRALRETDTGAGRSLNQYDMRLGHAYRGGDGTLDPGKV